MTYVLSDEQRGTLRQSIGIVVQQEDLDTSPPRPLITVGDMVTATAQQQDIQPDVSVVDYRVERSPCSPEVKQTVQRAGTSVRRVSNPAGTITDELWQAVEAALADDTATRIEVDGEEDLAALAAISLAPVGATVMYGLPSQGIAQVTVDAATKEKVKHVLQDMEE